MANTPILGLPQVSPTQAQKEVTINDAIVALESATNGNLLVTYGTEVTKTLSETQFTRSFLFTADVTTADAILQVPATIAGDPSKRLFCVRNKTTFGLTVRSASGTGGAITIPNGEARLLCISDDEVFVAAEPSTPVSFLALGETPDSYAGMAGQFLKVAAGEDGLVFVALTTTIDNFDDVDLTGQTDGKVLIRTGGVWKPGSFPTQVTTFLGLDDVPDAYGGAGTFARVNGSNNGIEFVSINQVPAGAGTAGQILTKGTGTSYAWADAPTGTGVPAGGTTGQVLTKVSGTDGDADWANPTGGSGLPAGGTTGQFLAKASGTDGDADWVDATGIADAPSDGTEYVRKNAGWVHSTGGGGGGGISDAPSDGTPYARQDADWVAISTIADGTHFASLYAWDQAVDGNLAGGTTVVVDVSDYDEILILIDRETKATASSETVRFSTDGGVTFDSGNNYMMDLSNSGGVGFADNAIYSNGNGAGARTFMWRASNLRSTISPKPVFGNRQGLYVGYAAVTHVQLTIATTYNGGRINVLGLVAQGVSGGTGGSATESLIIAVGDEASAVTTGTAKVTFRMPYAFTLNGVKASLTGASSSGNPTVDINSAGTSILSTKLSIDSGEKTSKTASIPAVISNPSLAEDVEMTIDVDIAGTGATGLKVYLIGNQ